MRIDPEDGTENRAPQHDRQVVLQAPKAWEMSAGLPTHRAVLARHRMLRERLRLPFLSLLERLRLRFFTRSLLLLRRSWEGSVPGSGEQEQEQELE